MNPVCPGFMAHHVKPNRCRRCFRDMHDHDPNKDVSTSFTISLPRRRRESVAISESPRKVEEPLIDPTATFTFRSLDRKPRQRSTSTSSWFQEKKEVTAQKDKIDSLFRNAEDSIMLYHKRDDDEDSFRAESPLMVRQRWRPTEHPTMAKFREPETPPTSNSIDKLKTIEAGIRTRAAVKSQRALESATNNNSIANSRDIDDVKSKTASLKRTEEVKSPLLRSPETTSKNSIEKDTPPKIPPKTSDSKTNLLNMDNKISDKKVTDSKSNSKTPEPAPKVDPKVVEKKPVMSRFLDDRFKDSKASEVKPVTPKPIEPKPPVVRRDSKVGSVLLKFEAPIVKDKPPDKLGTTKSEVKPVFSRFPSLKKEEPKPEVETKPVTSKPKPPPSSSSGEESESESEEEPAPKPSAQKLSNAITKVAEPKPLVTKVTDPKPSITKVTDLKPSITKVTDLKPSITKVTDPKPPITKVVDRKPSITKINDQKVDIVDKSPLTKFSELKPISKFGDQKSSLNLTDKKDSKPAENSTPEAAFVVKLKSPPVTQDDKVKDQEKQLQQQETKISDLQKTIETLRKDLKKSEENYSKLEKDKNDEKKKKQQQLDKDKEALEKTASELSRMRTKMTDMQNSQDQVREENRKLKTEAEKSKKDSENIKSDTEKTKRDLDKMKQDAEKSKKEAEKLKQEAEKTKQEVEKMKQEAEKAKQETKKKETTMQQQISNQQAAYDPKSKQTIDQLKQKLQQTDTLCQELMEENEDIKKEVRDLEQELEELHDNFREDQASEFRGLKKELETATKNCRVLQFKLRKAEKRGEQLELERHSLEDKMKEYQLATKTNTDKGRTKELENELKISKSLTSTLNSELDSLRAALQRSEAENEMLRLQDGGTRSLTPTSRRSPITGREGMATPLGKDYESLTRELYDTMERENDLREQFKFSEEEAKTARRKMNALEQENETLMLQMKKLNAVLRARKDIGVKKKGDADADEDEEEDLSADSLKLQLDLLEQEMGVMRRKLEDTEKENENFQSENKYLQEKLINQPLFPLPDLPDSKSSSSTGSIYWEKKAKLLEYELRETRRKIIEKERDIERLNTEVEIYRKKASKVMVRSRSLDNDLQVDLKRQLQLVEQEASILRQKVLTLENENEKLNSDNKRLNLRISRKPPLTSQEMAQLDNLELKQKNEELQRKLETLKQELLDKTGQNDNPVAILQEYKPRRESLTSLTDNENDLIQSLKKKLKTQEDDHHVLQNKCMHLEIDHNRLSREHRRLKEALNTKKKPMRAIRESASRTELKDLITELQDEISELQVSLRGREVMQESIEEELEQSRKELREAMRENKQKEDKLREELEKAKKEKEALEKETEIQKKRASTAETQLNQVSGQLGADQLQLSQKIRNLQDELEETERKTKAAEEALEKKTRRLRDTQEKLNTTTAHKEDIGRTNRLLQSQKDDLAKELEDHKELLSKAESRIKELRNQMDNTDRDLTSLRKECNQLRNELEDERSRLKQMDKKTLIESSAVSTKERDDLRRTNGELRTKVENLQHQITHNEQIWIEKEARMREDFKRKKEVAVRDAREKGEAALALAKEEEKIVRGKVQETTEKLEKAETSMKESQEKTRQAATQHRREKEEWQVKKDDLEGKVRAEIKKRERTEREGEQNLKAKEEELLKSKDRLVQLEREQRRIQIQIEEAEQTKQKSAFLEKEVDRFRQEYDDLTNKYDLLEEEFVKTKSKFVQEKEAAETQLQCLQRDVNNLTADNTMMKDTHKAKQDTWNKEKAEMQDRLKEHERRLERLKTLEQERLRIKNLLDEKETLIESYRKEEKHLKEERERLRRSVDEMSRASEVQRQAWITSASSSSDPKAVKELSALRSDYDGKMTMMSHEIASMQSQISNLATERDNLKSRLSTAERSAEEVKTGSLKRERARHRDEAELARRKVKELKVQLEEMKEQLEDNLLENKSLRLQIETDRNSSEIETSQLKSKINQLEEQKILDSTRGQTRNLARTRLELAWEKERGEQQHLLAESQKLVLDLKNRLEATEVEREKEKQALRREVNHVREVSDKDSQENRRKMSELHSSLLEIRESQAKLRGLYDRMKREREILLSERDEWRQKLQLATQIHALVQTLQSDVEIVTAAASSKKVTLTPEINEALTKVKEQFTELQKSILSLKDDERFKRTTSFRRAVSAQEMNHPSSNDPSQRQLHRVSNYPAAPPTLGMRPPPRLKSLHRKSLSLDHTLTGTAQFRDSIKIWESEGESAGSTPAGSLLSLRMGGHYGYESDSSFAESEYKYGGSLQEYRMRRRYLQTPSGMSTDNEGFQSSREGSVATSCESVPATVQQSTQKKSSTLKDKLKLLRRTKSIEVTNVSEDVSKEAKEKSLRSKISKVLRKPLSRSVSMDVHKSRGPALPPKGIVSEAAPKRPTSEKPLSASRGELSSTQRPLTRRPASDSTKSGRETPV